MDYPADLSFLFTSPTRIVFGVGSSADVGVELRGLSVRRALVVTDRFLYEKTDIVKGVEKSLGAACAGVFSDVPADSGVHVVNAGAEFGQERGADSIVSVGGGSVIDTAKGIAILLTEGGSLLDYQGFQVLTRGQTPHVCIPTTAGTGSEVTYVAVIKDHENEQQAALRRPPHHPRCRDSGPRLTVDLPPLLTAATGLDAFSHGLEAITSAQREPISDALGLHAIRLVMRFLPRGGERRRGPDGAGADAHRRDPGGAAFSNAQVGLIHAIAHVVGRATRRAPRHRERHRHAARHEVQ